MSEVDVLLTGISSGLRAAEILYEIDFTSAAIRPRAITEVLLVLISARQLDQADCIPSQSYYHVAGRLNDAETFRRIVTSLHEMDCK